MLKLKVYRLTDTGGRTYILTALATAYEVGFIRHPLGLASSVDRYVDVGDLPDRGENRELGLTWERVEGGMTRDEIADWRRRHPQRAQPTPRYR